MKRIFLPVIGLVMVFYHAVDSKLLTGKPTFQSQKNAGTTYFDDFVIKEYDESQ